jgi:hypothetical protein
LVRQSAFQDEAPEPTSPRLNVRFLPTIPSAPDSSVQMDDENDNENKEQESVEQEQQLHIQMPAVESSTNSSSLMIKSKPP